MITDYTRPQLVIKQQLQRLPNGFRRTIGAFTFGPQFFLSRYTRAAERAKLTGVLFEEETSTDAADWQNVPYEGKLTNHIPDLTYSRLFAENLEAQLLDLEQPTDTDREHINGDLLVAHVNRPARARLLALSKPNRLRVTVQGLVVALETTSGVITAATIVSGGLGFTPSQTAEDPYHVEVVGVDDNNEAAEGTGGILHVTTDADGRVTSIVAVIDGGADYEDVTVEIPAPTPCVNLQDVDSETPLFPLLRGRPVKAGDVVYVRHTDPNNTVVKTVRRTVIGVERDEAAAHVGTNSSEAGVLLATNELFAEDLGRNPSSQAAAFTQGAKPTNWTVALNSACLASDWNGLVQGSSYNGAYGDFYTLTVVKGGDADTARLKIRTSSGGFSANEVGADGEITSTEASDITTFKIDHAALGGLVISLVSPEGVTELVSGQIFSFTILGTYDGVLDGSTHNDVPRLVLKPNTVYAGNRNTRYVVTVTKGATTAFKRAAIKVTSVSSGKVAGVSLLHGGYGYPASSLITGALLPTTYSADGGTGAKLLLITNSDGEVTSVVVKSHADEEVTSGANNVITLTAHGLTVGQRVKFAAGGGSLPSGITANTWYFVRTVPDANTFTLTATVGGSVLTVASGSTFDMTTETVGGADYSVNDMIYPITTTAMKPTAPYAGAELLVTDTAGIDRQRTFTVTHGTYMDLGTYGLQFQLATLDNDNSDTGKDDPAVFNTGLRKGDTFYIDAIAAAKVGPLGVLVLSGQAADTTIWDEMDRATTAFDLDFRVVFNGEISPLGNQAPDTAWTAWAEGISIRNDLALEVSGRDEDYTWCPVKTSAKGKVFAHWRGLVPAVSGETIKLYRNEADIKTKFGIEDLENPACMAALVAFRGSQGKGVYATRLATNDLAGYVAVLRQAERVDGIYALAPATNDLTVQQAVRDHVGKCSQDDWKLWRRAYVSVVSPGTYALVTTDTDGEDVTGTITSNGSGNVVLTSAGANFVTNGVRPGDLIRTSYNVDEWGNPTYTTYTVDAITSDDEVLLLTGPSSPITPAVKLEIWRPDTSLSQAEFVGNRAESFADRRVCVVWADNPLTINSAGSLVAAPAYYLAAEIAGLRSALLQQQGLTYTELDYALDRAPSMFTRFTQEDLNLAASKGVMVVTQEGEDGPCFIRHQLTTKTTLGSLYYEDSVGYNLDIISYGFKDVLQPYIGKQNATPETLSSIDTKIRTLLSGFKAVSQDSTVLGPPLLGYSYNGVPDSFLLEIDANLRDRINSGVSLELPLPVNSIVVNLLATTVQNETLAAAV